MIKSSPGEVSVEELKGAIREAVARREAEGRASFINASTELFKILTDELLSPGVPALTESQVTELASRLDEIALLKLQPEFSLHDDGRYHVNDLLQYHDSAFIWNAYLALLKREPDEEGFQAYLKLLRSGRRNKIDILASLHRSPEGKRAKTSIEGLTGAAMIRRLYRLPVIGYLLEFVITLARLPLLVRSQRQTENHLVAQQDRVAGHFNYTNRQLVDEIERRHRELKTILNELSNSMSDLFERQQRIAELHHRQVAALFEGQQKLKDSNGSITPSNGYAQRARINMLPGGSKSDPFDLDKLKAEFTDQVRGASEVVKDDLKWYLSLLKDADVSEGILDLGCGRGEWLELLEQEGLRAVGVESNRTLVRAARSRGYEVTHQEAIQHLHGLANESLHAITGFHLIEHLDFDRLLELLIEARRTLKPGGLLILETPNPKNLVVGACNFYADPTHHRPIFPETLQFLLNGLGFERTRIEYRHPVEGSPFTDAEPGSKELDTWLFGPRDYAAIGWKA